MIRVRRVSQPHDQGFTLVEVVVALTLLTLVAAAAGMLMIRSLDSATAMDDQKGAVQVARQTMEQVRAVPPVKQVGKSSLPPSTLVQGRSKTAVQQAWSLPSVAGIDTSDTFTGLGSDAADADTYDTTAETSPTPVIPITKVFTLTNRPFTVTTLIGTCRRVRTGSACDRSTTGDELYRVFVVVTWTTGATHVPHTYRTIDLVDPSGQVSFNVNRPPKAADDSATTYADQSVDIPVLSNDSGSWPFTGAVTVTASPAHGKTTIANDIVIYKPTSTAWTGTDTFTYQATDAKGSASTATVTVTVKPALAVKSPISLTQTGSVSATYDLIGTGAVSGGATSYAYSIQPTTSGAPSATVSSAGLITVTPAATLKTPYSYAVTVTDSSNAHSKATITVTVTRSS